MSPVGAWRTLPVFGLLFLLCQSLQADNLSTPCQSNWLEPPKLTVVTTPFPPYVVEQGGLVSGPATEVVRQVCERAGAQCEFVAFPWARSFHLAQTDSNTLIYSLARNPERETRFQWLGTVSPYNVKLFALKDSIVPEVEDWRELAGYRVAGQIKDVKALYLANARFEVDFTATAENTIQMLYHDRVHLVAGDARSLPYRVEKMGLSLERLRVVADIPELSSDLYLAAHTQSPVEVMQRLTSCLKELKAEGAFDRIWAGGRASNS